MDQALLDIQNVSLEFGGIRALHNVSLSLRGSEIVALVGPNGAGKTCVLNIISGVYRPTAGTAHFEGRELVGIPPHKIANLGIARTFQNGELFHNLTVVENLLLGCHHLMRSNIFQSGFFWGFARREEIELRRRVEEVIDFLELGRYRKQLTANLPFGVQKLVGVGRALAMKPKLLLLDEPGSGLNRQEKEDLARFLLRIKYQMGVPMLWVEHDIKMVSDLSDRIIVLHYGERIAEGTMDELSNNPQVVQAFLGDKSDVVAV